MYIYHIHYIKIILFNRPYWFVINILELFKEKNKRFLNATPAVSSSLYYDIEFYLVLVLHYS
jgi:hypothetical protein